MVIYIYILKYKRIPKGTTDIPHITCCGCKDGARPFGFDPETSCYDHAHDEDGVEPDFQEPHLRSDSRGPTQRVLNRDSWGGYHYSSKHISDNYLKVKSTYQVLLWAIWSPGHVAGSLHGVCTYNLLVGTAADLGLTLGRNGIDLRQRTLRLVLVWPSESCPGTNQSVRCR